MKDMNIFMFVLGLYPVCISDTLHVSLDIARVTSSENISVPEAKIWNISGRCEYLKKEKNT